METKKAVSSLEERSEPDEFVAAGERRYLRRTTPRSEKWQSSEYA
jgi:hypothetical protein